MPILVIFGVLFFLYMIAVQFSPGSYGNAEEYELDYSEELVIDAISKLKENYPSISAPKYLEDGKTDDTSHWYMNYFCLRDENKILLTWIRPSGKSTTTFALVSVNEGSGLGNWKDVNEDLSFSENKRIKTKFENEILAKIKEQLETTK